MLLYLEIKSGVVSGADRKRSDLSMAELGLAELNGRCRVCVSVISSLEPELDLAKFGF